MANFKLGYLLIFLFIIEAQAQNKQAALVFFEEKDLSSLISNIISENNKCKKGIWYVEIKDSSNILLSKSYLSNLTESLTENDELYMTTINNNVVFIVTDIKYDTFFKKTFFHMELPVFTELDYVYFSNFSFWHLQKKMTDEFYVVQEKIYSCN